MATKLIPSYKHQVRPIGVYSNVFDTKTKTLKPIKSMDDTDVTEVLDSITLAMQAGTVSAHGWPQQFFANRKAFEGFIQQLEGYDECFRITDEWWMALARLIGTEDEEGFISTRDMANAILDKAAEDGLLSSWRKKKPVYKHSPEECEEASYQLCVLYESLDNNMGKATEEQRDKHYKLCDITAFGQQYFGNQLTDERKAQASAEAAPALAALMAKQKKAKKNS